MIDTMDSSQHPARIAFGILGAPIAWAAQLVVSWLVDSWACLGGPESEPARSGGPVHSTLMAIDIGAVLICLAALWVSIGLWKASENESLVAVHGRDRATFLSGTALLVSATFLVATLLQLLPTFVLPVCATVR